MARVAGVMAAKRTSEIVPLCHNGVGLEGVRVEVRVVGPAEGEGGGEFGRAGWADEGGVEGAEVYGGVDKGSGKGIGRYGGVRIECRVECEGKTGVEMEALTGVVGAGLTVVDMVKGVDRGVRMEGVRVVRKEGGRSGVWRAEGWEG